MQYQLRDRNAADREWRGVLRPQLRKQVARRWPHCSLRAPGGGLVCLEEKATMPVCLRKSWERTQARDSFATARSVRWAVAATSTATARREPSFSRRNRIGKSPSTLRLSGPPGSPSLPPGTRTRQFGWQLTAFERSRRRATERRLGFAWLRRRLLPRFRNLCRSAAAWIPARRTCPRPRPKPPCSRRWAPFAGWPWRDNRWDANRVR